MSDITVFAAEATYEAERYKIREKKRGNDLDNNSVVAYTNEYMHEISSIYPSNLEAVDFGYDEATGTSYTLFQDTETERDIMAFTGANLDGDAGNDVWESD